MPPAEVTPQDPELPLFPLHSVLFPGAELRLRIFETRYIDLIRACLRDNVVFGVVGIRHGSEVGTAACYEVGTTARIVDWTLEPDGLLGIVVAGERRFSIASVERRADGLYIGRIECLHDAESFVADADLAWARDLLDQMMKADTDRTPIASDDAQSIIWRLAEMLPLPFGDRQSLLASRSQAERLQHLRSFATGST